MSASEVEKALINVLRSRVRSALPDGHDRRPDAVTTSQACEPILPAKSLVRSQVDHTVIHDRCKDWIDNEQSRQQRHSGTIPSTGVIPNLVLLKTWHLPHRCQVIDEHLELKGQENQKEWVRKFEKACAVDMPNPDLHQRNAKQHEKEDGSACDEMHVNPPAHAGRSRQYFARP